MPEQIGFFGSLKNLAGKIFTFNDNLSTPAVIAGDLLYGSAAGVLSALAKGAANLKLFMKADGTIPEWASGIYIGTFTYDTATASGTTNHTGVGFKPSFVIFLAIVNSTPQMSVGFDNDTNHFCIADYNGVSADQWTYDTQGISLAQASGILCQGKITTLGADGFTITWVKTGAKTGTAKVYYMAFR